MVMKGLRKWKNRRLIRIISFIDLNNSFIKSSQTMHLASQTNQILSGVENVFEGGLGLPKMFSLSAKNLINLHSNFPCTFDQLSMTNDTA